MSLQEKIKIQKFIPLFYHDNVDHCIKVVDILYKYGFFIIEFTNRGKNAAANFARLQELKAEKWPELELGIGTIANKQDAETFLQLNAAFLISPFYEEGIAETVKGSRTAWMPGSITPYEINLAIKAGCEIVKLFPGNLISPDYVKAIKEVFPNTKFMPTGGVDMVLDDLRNWFGAGVIAVGLGSKLVSKDILEKQDWDLLETRLQAAKELQQRL